MTFYEALLDLKKQSLIDGDIEYEQLEPVQQGVTSVEEQPHLNTTIIEHSRDASVFEIIPRMVFFPKKVADIQLVLQTAQNHLDEKITISVRAGGTCMSGGSLTPGLIINMTRYINEFQIDPIERTGIVEMGTMFKAFADSAETHGLLFGAYTSSKDICGFGGMIGNNASGEKSIRMGATIDNVLGLEVILADGTLIRTGALENTGESLKGLLSTTGYKESLLSLHNSVNETLVDAIGEVTKAASGYRLERVLPAKDGLVDLTPIFIGAQGTLGIVTRAFVQLKPIPEFTRLLVISVDSMDELPFILQTLMKHNPEGVETFDVNTFNRAKATLKDETEISQQFFTEKTELVVLAQFSEESQEATDILAKHCEKALETHPVRVSFIDASKVQQSIWKIRRSSYGVMRLNNPAGTYAVPCIEDVIVPIKNFDKFIPELQKILKQYNIQYGFHGHIGDGSLRIIPVFDFTVGSEKVSDTIIAMTRDVIALVKSLKGNMSTDHSDGIIRTPFLREFYGEKVFEAFVKVKLLFDPNGIMNRGKKIGGTEDMIRKYIIKA